VQYSLWQKRGRLQKKLTIPESGVLIFSSTYGRHFVALLAIRLSILAKVFLKYIANMGFCLSFGSQYSSHTGSRRRRWVVYPKKLGLQVFNTFQCPGILLSAFIKIAVQVKVLEFSSKAIHTGTILMGADTPRLRQPSYNKLSIKHNTMSLGSLIFFKPARDRGSCLS